MTPLAKMLTILATGILIFQSCTIADYQAGNPGAKWNQQDIHIVRSRVMTMLDLDWERKNAILNDFVEENLRFWPDGSVR